MEISSSTRRKNADGGWKTIRYVPVSSEFGESSVMRPSASVCAAASKRLAAVELDDHAFRGLAALGVEHVRGDHEAEDLTSAAPAPEAAFGIDDLPGDPLPFVGAEPGDQPCGIVGLPPAAQRILGRGSQSSGIQPVSVGPGEIVFTVIPRSISSSDSVTVTWCRAPLEAAYATDPFMGPRCWPDVNSTTRPPGRPSCWSANSFTSSSDARDVDVEVGVQVVSRQLCQGARCLLERVVDDEDVDVAERVLRRTDDGCRSRGIREIGLDMRHGAACLLQLGEHCRQPAGSGFSSPAAHEWMRTPLPAASSLRATAKPIPFLRLTPVTTAALDTPRIYCPCG